MFKFNVAGAILVAVIAGVAANAQAPTQGFVGPVPAPAGGNSKAGRAVVYTAKIPASEAAGPQDYEQITRRYGSVEIFTFPAELGPENLTDRTLIRLGEPGYSCPGMTVWVRKSLEADRAAGKLVRATSPNAWRTADANARQRVSCALPQVQNDPIRATVYLDGALRLTVEQTEIASPSGGTRWPSRCTIRVPEKGVIVQILDYDGQAPAPTPIAVSSGVVTEGPVNGDEGPAGMLRGTDTLSFSCTWGPSWNFDTGWQPGGDQRDCPGGPPLAVRLNAGLGLQLGADASGTFSFDGSNLCVAGGSGSLHGDIGAEFAVRGMVDVWIVPQFCFDIPYLPSFDFRAQCQKGFNSWLLDSNAVCADTIGPVQIYCFNLSPIPYTTAGFCLNGSLSIQASMTCDSITTSAGQTFTSEGQCRSVSGGCEYHAAASYNENLTVTATLHVSPSLHLSVEIWPYPSWDLPIIDIPWTPYNGRFDLPCPTSSLDFSLPHTVPTPSRPTGPSTLCRGESGSYTTSVETGGDSCGHALQFQFDWGDGTQSGWGGATQSHSWSNGGTFPVKARARCSVDTSKVSNWSPPLSVTVNPPPTAPSGATASPNPACAGNQVTLSAQGGSGGTYKWYAGGCGSGGSIGSGQSITITAPAQTTTYYVRVESSCGNSDCAWVTLNITPPPTAPTGATASPNPACPGDPVTLTAQGGSGGTYRWYAGGCASGGSIGSGPSITITAPAQTTTYYVRVEGVCGASNCASVTLAITTSPTAPTGATASPNPACAGEQVTLSAQGGSGGTYTWYAGGCGSGASIGSGQSINTTAPPSPTTYYVRMEGTCGTTDCASVTLSITPLPTAPSGVIVSPNPACPGDPVTLSAQGGSGGTARWYVGGCGSGISIGSGQSITIIALSSTTTYCVRFENSCGVSNCACVTLNITPPPTAPSGATASPNPACPGDQVTLSAQGGSGGTYKWYAGACGSGAPIGSGASITITVPAQATTYYVRVEGVCGTSNCASVTLDITTSATAPSGATASVNPACAGDPVTLSAQGGAGGTYKWYAGGCGSGASIGSGQSINVTAPPSTTAYYVRMEGGCGTTNCASVTLSITNSATAPSGATASPNPAYPGDQVVLAASGGSGGTLTWYAGGCGSGAPIGTGQSIEITVPRSTTTYYVRAEGSCGSSDCASVTLAIVRSCTLTVTPQGQGTVTLAPPGPTYDEGTHVQLTAAPNAGWDFVEWRGDLTGSANPATLVMTADKTVNAVFELSEGACCLPDDTCRVVSEARCATLNGNWLGTNVPCTQCPPPPTGACSFRDGTCIEQMTETDCASAGGTFLGVGRDCTGEPTRIGACCSTNGSCTEKVTQADCESTGGSYQGNNTDCTPNQCPQLGGCCFADGTCEVMSGGDCAAAGGLYRGDGSACEPNTCPCAGCGCGPCGAGLFGAVPLTALALCGMKYAGFRRSRNRRERVVRS